MKNVINIIFRFIKPIFEYIQRVKANYIDYVITGIIVFGIPIVGIVGSVDGHLEGFEMSYLEVLLACFIVYLSLVSAIWVVSLLDETWFKASWNDNRHMKEKIRLWKEKNERRKQSKIGN